MEEKTSYKTASGNHCCNWNKQRLFRRTAHCYKTASGNHCCNVLQIFFYGRRTAVTKPQAVITVATEIYNRRIVVMLRYITKPQAVITVATH